MQGDAEFRSKPEDIGTSVIIQVECFLLRILGMDWWPRNTNKIYGTCCHEANVSSGFSSGQAMQQLRWVNSLV